MVEHADDLVVPKETKTACVCVCVYVCFFFTMPALAVADSHCLAYCLAYTKIVYRCYRCLEKKRITLIPNPIPTLL